jgi:hypothetical protein
MKRISLILFLISAILVGNAQDPILKHRKKSNANTTTNAEVTTQDTSKATTVNNNVAEDQAVSPIKHDRDGVSGNVSTHENALLASAIDNAFLVVKADYNVRDKEDGSNLSGNNFFGSVYSVVPLLPYGFGVDNRFLTPWKSDPNYDANKYGDDMVSVDNLEYKKPKEAAFMPFKMNRTTDQSLAPGFYHVTDSSFKNLGLHVELGNGVKSGYMVWFRINPENGEASYSIHPTNITFNENSIFTVRQPLDPETVIGGAFLNMNADEPGCLRLNLMAVARIDPYGGKKWELVKLQSQPVPPVKDTPAVKEDEKEKAKNKSAQVESNDNGDSSIIPAQEESKDKKKSKDSKKGNSKDNDKSNAASNGKDKK